MRIESIVLSSFLASVAGAETVQVKFVDGGKPVANRPVTGQLYNKDKPFFLKTLRTGADGTVTFDVGDLSVTAGRFAGALYLADKRVFIYAVKASGETLDAGGSYSPVSVLVRNSKGATVHQATVRPVFVQTDRGLSNLDAASLQSARDDSGAVTLGQFPIGAKLHVSISAPGLIGKELELDQPQPGKPAEVMLPGAGTLTGRTLVDGNPKSGVTVFATYMESEHTVSTVRAVSGKDGSYSLSVPAGLCSLSASLDKSDLVSENYLSIKSVEGKEVDSFDFHFKPGIPLRVVVTSQDDDKPIPGSKIRESAQTGEPHIETTGPDGSVTFHVAPGQIYLALDGFASRALPNLRYAYAQVDASSHPDVLFAVPRALSLPPIHGLTGLVTDDHGAPVAGAVVGILDDREVLDTVTDGNGVYRFTGSIDPDHHVIAKFKGAISAAGTVTGPQLDLKLSEKASSISGVVTDDLGKPIAKADVTLGGKIGEGHSYFSTKTDEHGAYAFPDLSGDYSSMYIWFKKPGFGDETIQPIKLGPNEAKVLGQKLVPADGVIAGVVLDENGKPAADLQVSGQQHGGYATTDAQGKFVLAKVTRGKTYVAVWENRQGRGGAEAHDGQMDLVIKLNPTPKVVAGFVSQEVAGHVAAEFNVAKWIQGSPLSLAGQKGKLVVIDFWGVHCRPCIESLPAVEELHRRYAAKGVVFVGICDPYDGDKLGLAILKKAGVTYANAVDGANKDHQPLTHLKYGYGGIPHLILVSPDGHILVDTNDHEDIEAKLKELVKS